MPQRAMIESIPRAYRMLKEMRAQELEWDEDYRRTGAEALKGVLERGMAARIDGSSGRDGGTRGSGPAQWELWAVADDGVGGD